MKTIKIFFGVVAIASASLGMILPESSTEKFASEVIRSLQNTSREQFGALFPTLDEFYEVMELNKEFYGENFKAAKQEFTDDYNHRIAPGIVEAYESVQHKAAIAGIDWNKVSVVRVVVDEGGDLERRTMSIYFSADGDVHNLTIDGAFKLNGQWKVSGNMTLN